jgi:T-complex protein 1 subunit theta
LLKSAEDLLNYNKSEEKKMEEIVSGIASSGVNVVISHGSIRFDNLNDLLLNVFNS